MPIINKGIFNVNSIYLRDVGNDWPTAQVISTTDIVEGTNEYFTNAKARAVFTEGLGIAISSAGVISARGDDTGTGIFSSGINLAANLTASSAFSTVKTFSSTEGNTFIVYSYHVTNISNNTAYLTGRVTFNSNTILFANLLEMPVGSSLEIFRKPQIFKVGDTIQIQSFNNTRTPGNNLISSYLSYQGSTDDTYQRIGATISDNSLTEVYQTSGRTSIIESINLVNLGPNLIPTTVLITDNSDTVLAYLTSNLLVPAYAAVEVCEYPKSLLDNYKIKVQKFDNPLNMSVFISSKYTSSYDITPAAASLDETGSIVFDINTTNLIDGTQVYYEVSTVVGNITQADFVSNLSGVLTLENNTVKLTLQANTDNNVGYEGDETFKVIVRRGSLVGSVVATSSNVVLKDTSNTIAYNSLVESADTAVEGGVITFTLNTTNLGPNTSIYYTTVGNVTSASFTTGNTGTVLTTGSTTSIGLTTTSTIPDNETRYFQLQVRESSLTGDIKITSNTINIVDSLQGFISATGGTKFNRNGFYEHYFTSSNTFIVTGLGVPTNRNVEYLVVAGGGNGGGPSVGLSGGGGAGGVQTGNVNLSSTGNYSIIVGAGASVGVNGNGSNSNIFLAGFVNISAFGGGSGGLFNDPSKVAKMGGSGGGGAVIPLGLGGAGTPGQGNPGGRALSNSGDGYGGAGGGGGYSQAGFDDDGGPAAVPSPSPRSQGGNGIARSWIESNYGTPNNMGGSPSPSPLRWFAGGGGGSTQSANTPTVRYGNGGLGGGGGAFEKVLLPWGVSGKVNTGGGGVGGGYGTPNATGAGGSGIVIIRYPSA